MRWARTFSGDDVRHDGNIFNLLRLVFASAVVVAHGYVLTGHPADDPTIPLLPFSLGRTAVLSFFSLSGFLVTNSMLTRGPARFAVARGLRILPGLWVMLLVTTLAAAAFVARPLAATIGSGDWWRYVGFNGALVGRYYGIPGAFAGNPLPDVVNGSLWSIPREVQCYLLLMALAVSGLLTRRGLLTAAFLAVAVVDMVVPRDLVPALTDLRELALSFFAGTLLWLWRDRVPLAWPIAAGLMLLCWALPAGAPRQILCQWTLAYLIIVAGVRVPRAVKAAAARLSDYSYGVYIYAFPAQQAVFALGWGTTPVANMGLAMAITLPLAALSWHLVEKPANGLKGRFGPRRAMRAG